MRELLVLLVLAGVVTGCADRRSVDGDEAPVVEVEVGDEGEVGGAVAEETPLSMDDPAVRDAVLLTAIDEALAGTDAEGLVDEDPGAVLEVASLVCERLDAGADPATLLRAFVDALSAPAVSESEDVPYVAGVVFGATVTTRCPEHAEVIESLES